MFKKFLSLIILIVINTLPASEYNLESIIQLAEEKNKDIRLARAELKTASALKLEAISSALPTFEINAGYNRNFRENIFYFEAPDFQTGEITTQSFKTSFNNEYRLNAVLSQTIFSFDVGTAIQAANYYNKYTNYQFDTQRQAVITGVKKAFYQALLAQKVLEVSKDSETSAKDNYENISIRFEAGAASEFDKLQAEVRWQNSIPNTIRAQRNYDIALNNLKSLVEIPISEDLTLSGSLENYPPIPQGLNFEDVIGQRPDYAALQWEKRLQEKNVQVQYGNFLPSLKGNLTYSYTAASDKFKLERDNDNIILGLSLNIPIFTGGFNIAQVRKARAEVEKVKTRIAKADDNIQIEMQNIQLRLNEANQRIQATRKSVNVAERTFELAMSQAESGIITQVELKENRVALDEAQLNYYTAIYDYLESYFDWEQATGNVTTNSFN
jgi:outer membrane protein TolC